MQVEQIDREAGADFMGSIPAFYGQEQPMRDALHDTSLIVQAFARHRHQARAEVVGEIVALLDGHVKFHLSAVEAGGKTGAGMPAVSGGIAALRMLQRQIEAKFGGRDE